MYESYHIRILFKNISFLGLKNKHIYHELCQGWHFKTLLIARIVPLITPFSNITSIAYAEQVGWNLHVDGNKGEIKYL